MSNNNNNDIVFLFMQYKFNTSTIKSYWGRTLVLERIVTVKDALRQPVWVFIAGGIISTISLAISFAIFHESIGLFSCFLTTFAAMPFMMNLARYEESLIESSPGLQEMNIFKRHERIIKAYCAFFAGMILTQSIIYIILPENIVEKVFEDQLREIQRIRGSFAFGGTFFSIFLNNVSVLTLCFLFSFIYGAGAIFILSWNASVLSTAIGMTAKSLGGWKAIPLALLTYFPHGSLEILAYFIGGIAGSLVSVSLSKRRPYKISLILKDSMELMMVAIILLLLGAGVETILLLS